MDCPRDFDEMVEDLQPRNVLWSRNHQMRSSSQFWQSQAMMGRLSVVVQKVEAREEVRTGGKERERRAERQ